MMKVSDPKIFGHAVSVYYKDVFEKHGETLKKLGVDPDNGHRRPLRQDQDVAGRSTQSDRSRHPGGLQEAASAWRW